MARAPEILAAAEEELAHPGKLLHVTNRSGDRLFEGMVTAAAAAGLLILAAIGLLLAFDSWPAIARYGLGFFTQTIWDPVAEEFGAAAYIYGTLATSALALLFAGPVAVGAAVFLAEYAPGWLRATLGFLLELLAAIPSIIYGLWGFFVMAPFLRTVVEPLLQTTFEPVPVLGVLFSGPTLGKDLLAGGLILAVMILPTMAAVSREVIRAIPGSLREAMIALGATKWEVIWRVVLPSARVGIAAAAILGLARALGETMAVTMVVGNSTTDIRPSLFTPGYTMASAIANQFTEADTEIYFSAVVEVGLVLLLVAVAVNVLARLILWRLAAHIPEARL